MHHRPQGPFGTQQGSSDERWERLAPTDEAQLVVPLGSSGAGLGGQRKATVADVRRMLLAGAGTALFVAFTPDSTELQYRPAAFRLSSAPSASRCCPRR
jgi:hypothetical protein